MEDCKPVCTPMITGSKISKDDDSTTVDKTLYKSMIGKLIYLTQSRPGISNAVGIVGRFVAEPKHNHLMAIKRIFRYLKGTIDYGLWYPKLENVQLHVYTDIDCASCIDEMNNTSGGAVFIGDRLVSWVRKKQNCISQTTIEVEYVATTLNCSTMVWIK